MLVFSACTKITDFESCAAAGNPVMESYPMKCQAGDTTYVQDVGRTYCKEEQRNAEICTMEYVPVCGYGKEMICENEPCGETFGNGCGACGDIRVEYYVEGECNE